MKTKISRLLFFIVLFSFAQSRGIGRASDWTTQFNICYANEFLSSEKNFPIKEAQKKCTEQVAEKFNLAKEDLNFSILSTKNTEFSSIYEITLIYKKIPEKPVTHILGRGKECGQKPKPSIKEVEYSLQELTQVLTLHPDSVKDIECGPGGDSKIFGFIEVNGKCQRICPVGKILRALGSLQFQCESCADLMQGSRYLHTNKKSNDCTDQGGCSIGYEAYNQKCLEVCEVGYKRDPLSGECVREPDYCDLRYSQATDIKRHLAIQQYPIPEVVCGYFKINDYFRQAIQRTEAALEDKLQRCQNDISQRTYMDFNWSKDLADQLKSEIKNTPDDPCIRSEIGQLEAVAYGMGYKGYIAERYKR